MTAASGAPVADNQNSLTAGERGPLLVQDWPLFEKHAHFNRERIPPTMSQLPSSVYEPDRFGGPVEDPGFKGPPLKISGDADRHRQGNDDYTQAENLFRLMKAEQKKALIENIVGAMKPVPRHIQERQVQHFFKADPAYGKGVAEGLGLPAPKAA